MKDNHIIALGCMSVTKEHELILEMLDRYNVMGIKDLTEEQVFEFLNEKLEEGGAYEN